MFGRFGAHRLSRGTTSNLVAAAGAVICSRGNNAECIGGTCSDKDKIAGGSRLRFGAIADIQYADVENRRGRNYRGTLEVASRAVQFFNESQHLDFLLHAGDIVDFYNTDGEFAGDGGRATSNAVGAVMSRLSQALCPNLVSLIGNHEMYNWSREELLSGISWEAKPFDKSNSHSKAQGILRFCPEGSSDLWFQFTPCKGWCCIVLDPYDISVYRKGRGQNPPPFSYDLDSTALTQLCKMNPNVAAFVKERPGENILCDYFTDLPPGPCQRWVPYNGAVGQRQMSWLREQLAAAAVRGESVVVFSHLLLHPESSNNMTLLWNYEEVLGLLQSPLGRTVQMVVSGHQHSGGFHTDELGIHYIVMESPLLTSPGMPGCFLVFEAGSSTLELKGYSNSDSVIFPGLAEGTLGHRRLPLRRSRADQGFTLTAESHV